jgi:putative ABC transport system ATP-binding protein
MLRLRNIEKAFRHGLSQTFVLRRVTLDITEGEFVSVMGPSGAGKSTLLHILGMHDSAWTGEYWLGEEPVHQLSAKERMRLQKQHVGFVFQSYHLLDNLTVYENIDLPLSYRDVKKTERQGMVADILDRFNIVGKKDLYPNQLSGGQQQLVAIARAVVAKPTLILADEPTGQLDTLTGASIIALLKTIATQTGVTVVVASHDPNVHEAADRILELKDGRLVGTVDQSGGAST